MAYRKMNNLIVEDAKIMYRNFQGAEDDYNREGDRNFCVIIEQEDTAQKLIEDGWNVKIRKPANEEYDPVYYIKVKVSFKELRNIPPMSAYLVTRRGKRRLTEDSIGCLDWSEFRNIDLIIRPYQWEKNGKSGVAAYLQTGYFTIEEDVFAEKYAEEEAPEEVPWD